MTKITIFASHYSKSSVAYHEYLRFLEGSPDVKILDSKNVLEKASFWKIILFKMINIMHKVFKKFNLNDGYDHFSTFNIFNLFEKEMVELFSDQKLLIIHGFADVTVHLDKVIKKCSDTKFKLVHHDANAFSGGCHLPFQCLGYEGDCESCPQLKIPSAYIQRKKRQIWSNICSLNNVSSVSPSYFLRDKIQEASYASHTVEVERNTVTYTPFPQTSFRILFIAGNYSRDKNKGYSRLIRLSELLPEYFVIYAVGDNNTVCHDIEHSHDNILHLGAISSQAVIRSLYEAVDCVISLSEYENYSGVLNEARYFGKDIVAFDVGGNREVLAGYDRAQFIEFGQTNKFVRALLSLAEKSHGVLE